METEHYGDSLESHPDYFFMKKMWLEDQIDLEKDDDLVIFVDPPNFISKDIFARVNFNIIKQTNEEDILRSTLGDSTEREIDRQVDIRGVTFV